MQKRHLNQHGFTLISTLAGAIMVSVSLLGLLVMSVYAHKKMNELYFHRCAILTASNYFQIFYSQLQSGKISSAELSTLRVPEIEIGRFFNGVGDTDNSQDPTAMEEKDYYTTVKGRVVPFVGTKYEVINNVEGLQKYYDLKVGCSWFVEGVDESDPDSPSLSNPNATFYIKGPVY